MSTEKLSEDAEYLLQELLDNEGLGISDDFPDQEDLELYCLGLAEYKSHRRLGRVLHITELGKEYLKRKGE